MIVSIKFKSDVEEFSMLFGDSYKSWQDQLAEYMFITKLRPYKPYHVHYSKKKWISYGGLKWCCLDNFQEELKKSNDKRNIDDFNFEDASDSIIKKIKNIEKYVFGGKDEII